MVHTVLVSSMVPSSRLNLDCYEDGMSLCLRLGFRYASIVTRIASWELRDISYRFFSFFVPACSWNCTMLVNCASCCFFR